MKNLKNFLLKIRMFLDLKSIKSVLSLLLYIIIGAIGEFLGIVSLFPFISILSNPAIIFTNTTINTIYTFLGFDTVNNFFIFLGIIFLISLYLRAGLVTLSKLYITKYTERCSYLASYKLLSRYTYQPYSFYFQRNVSDLIKNVTTEVAFVVKNVISPVLSMISSLINSLFVLIFIFYVSPGITILMIAVLSLLNMIIYYFIRKILSTIGRKRLSTTKEKFKIVDQIINSIKELKILRREKYFIDKYTTASLEYARTQVKGIVISEISRDIMEALVFSVILSIVMWYLITLGTIETIIPLLSIYGLTIYRLMPIFQTLFSSMAKIKFNAPTLEYIYQDLILQNTEKKYPESKNTLTITNSIKLENITYTYPGQTVPAINDISIEIKSGTIVGIAGPTGSGKTTLIDIILGLLTADSGALTVDGKVIDNTNIKNWQDMLGYVPQTICMLDDTISNNIALGVESVDLKKVKEAVKIADLESFIETNLSQKYDNEIGDRGVRLSGGQRQRIGIARALYKDPKVLVLDEATSSLDSVTESNIIESIRNIPNNKTVLMVTHRLETLKICDEIFIIDAGKIVASGKFDHLVETSSLFNDMVKNKEHYEKDS